MKTRVVRMYCQAKCHDVLVVQKWMTHEAIKEFWDSVKEFGVDEFNKAEIFAMQLSRSVRAINVLQEFEDGRPL
jgi:hypothetical protein